MKKFMEEFKAFVTRGNVMDMAIGVIIGGAFGAITGSLVNDVVTPLLAFLFKSPNTDALNITLRAADEAAGTEALVLGLGTFVGTIINFWSSPWFSSPSSRPSTRPTRLPRRPRRKGKRKPPRKRKPSPPAKSCSLPFWTS